MSDPALPEILVVDDDDLIRDALGRALRWHGFAVRLAASGAEAVDVYRQRGGDIAAVLLDVRMPGLDGPQTLAALQALDPEVRCCFLSGEGCDSEQLLALGAAHFFLKPVAVAEVVKVLRQLIGQP